MKKSNKIDKLMQQDHNPGKVYGLKILVFHLAIIVRIFQIVEIIKHNEDYGPFQDKTTIPLPPYGIYSQIGTRKWGVTLSLRRHIYARIKHPNFLFKLLRFGFHLLDKAIVRKAAYHRFHFLFIVKGHGAEGVS